MLRSVLKLAWDQHVSTQSFSPHSSNLQESFLEEQAIELMKAAAKATYGRKGDDVVQKNWAAIDAGAKQVVEVQVPESWKNAEDEGSSWLMQPTVLRMLRISLTTSSARSMLRKVTPPCICIQGLCRWYYTIRNCCIRETWYRS